MSDSSLKEEKDQRRRPGELANEDDKEDLVITLMNTKQRDLILDQVEKIKDNEWSFSKRNTQIESIDIFIIIKAGR